MSMIVEKHESEDELRYVLRPDRVRWRVLLGRIAATLSHIVLIALSVTVTVWIFNNAIIFGQAANVNEDLAVFVVFAVVTLPFIAGYLLLNLLLLLRQWHWYIWGNETIKATYAFVEIDRKWVKRLIPRAEVERIKVNPQDAEWRNRDRNNIAAVNDPYHGDLILHTTGNDIRFGCTLDYVEQLKMAEKITQILAQPAPIQIDSV